MKTNLIFASILYLLFSSKSNYEKPSLSVIDPPNTIGAVSFISNLTLEDSYTSLKNALQQNEDIQVIAELDHAENAESANLELEPTKVIFFGNPNMGTPIIQKDQLAALDLPLNVLFYAEDENVFAVYNSADYITSRYGVEGVETLPKISDSLKQLVGSAVKAQSQESSNHAVEKHEGIISVESKNDFEVTYTQLKSSIKSNENLSVIAELDHKQNAERVGKNLRSTKLIMFGNPNVGTPLMQSTRSIGLDLPQKMLVWEDENGTVTISYNDPEYIMKRHQSQGNSEEIGKIRGALDKLAISAAGL